MEIVQKGPFKVVGIKVVADWDSLWVEMPKAWKEFVARRTEIKNRIHDRFMDISLQEEKGKYTQLICAEVSEFAEVPEGMDAVEIPSQKYIYHRHIGPVADIAASFGKMYEWARENKHSVDEFKLDIGYTKEGLELEHDLFIRVVG